MRPAYEAPRRGRIYPAMGGVPATAIHELSDDGSLYCNTALRPYRGHPVVVREVGPGEVTCGNCRWRHRVRLILGGVP